MKRKIINIFNILLTALLLTGMAAGCADREKVPITSGTGDVAGVTESCTGQNTAENTADVPGTGECPEGYVYDYQVSMDPIPEEIAALGGPCEGTIHAFPSRIGMALTELEMEKDPVLKAEVEKRIPEIEAALEEEIGGEFVVDGVILFDDLAWVFFCTEVETGYQFDLYYGNNDYYAYTHNSQPIGNIIKVDYYYDEKESITLRENLLPIVKEFFADGDIKIRLKNGKMDEVDIAIIQYTDSIVDKHVEQEKIILLWKELQSYDDVFIYDLNVLFYPSQYKEMIKEKFNTMFRYDYGRVYAEETMTCLIEKGEIGCCFSYAEIWDGEDVNNLDALLQKYEEGNYGQGEIWDYWIP